MLHSKQWHSRTAILHEEVLQDSSATAPIPAPTTTPILQGYPYTIHPHTPTRAHPENSPFRIQFYMQKTKSSSSTTTTLQIPDSRNSTHRRQGDLLEMHPCVLQDLPVTFQTFQTFQSFMTFQPFQAILQFLHCSSISRDSTPFQHSPTRMHILQFLQTLQFDWFPQKLHRVPVGQLQTFYRHYILQRKGDVVISVKRASVKMSR